MPKKGFKTITVSDEAFEVLKENWSKNKQTYRKKGVTSFSGYLTYLSEEERKRNP
jgi:predicted CopG family antitoxin